MDTKQMLEDIYSKIGTKRINEWLEIVTDIWYWEHTYSVNKWEYQEGYYPISLSRLLSALWNKYIFEKWKIKYMWKSPSWSWKQNHIICTRILLNQDNSDCMLDDQSPETIKAIYDILLPPQTN